MTIALEYPLTSGLVMSLTALPTPVPPFTPVPVDAPAFAAPAPLVPFAPSVLPAVPDVEVSVIAPGPVLRDDVSHLTPEPPELPELDELPERLAIFCVALIRACALIVSSGASCAR